MLLLRTTWVLGHPHGSATLTKAPPEGSALVYDRVGVRGPLPVPLSQRVEQVSYWKEGEATDSAAQIEIVAHAILGPPAQFWKQTERFADVRQNDQENTGCAQYL